MRVFNHLPSQYPAPTESNADYILRCLCVGNDLREWLHAFPPVITSPMPYSTWQSAFARANGMPRKRCPCRQLARHFSHRCHRHQRQSPDSPLCFSLRCEAFCTGGFVVWRMLETIFLVNSQVTCCSCCCHFHRPRQGSPPSRSAHRVLAHLSH